MGLRCADGMHLCLRREHCGQQEREQPSALLKLATKSLQTDSSPRLETVSYSPQGLKPAVFLALRRCGWKPHPFKTILSKPFIGQILGCGFLLCCAEYRAQSLTCNDVLSGFHGHRYQFDVVGFLTFFPRGIRIALADRLY